MLQELSDWVCSWLLRSRVSMFVRISSAQSLQSKMAIPTMVCPRHYKMLVLQHCFSSRSISKRF